MGDLIRIEKPRGRRGGPRPGAGRKPGSENKDGGRFIYVAHEAEDPSVCKIGLTSNPYRRLAGLQQATWRHLVFGAVFTTASWREGILIESAVRSLLSGVQVRGEWYRISLDRVGSMVLEAAKSAMVEIAPFKDDDLLRRL